MKEDSFPQNGEEIALRVLFRRASAFVPLALSLAALVVVAIQVGLHGAAHEPDEGAAAHLWQLLMAGQVPFVGLFAVKWLPRTPRRALMVLACQLAAAICAAAPVFLLGL